tara:strand:- start:452 stop:676 length:225 start_codon:yes stop_codon:yes gene_type:complete
MQIYTDVEQCGLFGAQYFGIGEILVCSADALLKSKVGGYDQEHTNYLKPLGSQTLVLERTENCGPGWWEHTKTL